MAAEKILQNKILKHLKAQPGWWFKISDKYQIGIPDILGCYKGRFVAIEVKSRGHKPTLKQAYELQKIRENGGFAIFVDKFEDFELAIEQVYNSNGGIL